MLSLSSSVCAVFVFSGVSDVSPPFSGGEEDSFFSDDIKFFHFRVTVTLCTTRTVHLFNLLCNPT